MSLETGKYIDEEKEKESKEKKNGKQRDTLRRERDGKQREICCY